MEIEDITLSPAIDPIEEAIKRAQVARINLAMDELCKIMKMVNSAMILLVDIQESIMDDGEG